MSRRPQGLDGDSSQVRGRVHHQAGEGRRPGTDRQVPAQAEATKCPRVDPVSHLRGQVPGRLHPLRPGCVPVHVWHAAEPTGQRSRRSRLDTTPGTSGKLLPGPGDDAAFGRIDGNVATTCTGSSGPRFDPAPRGHVARLLSRAHLGLFAGPRGREEPRPVPVRCPGEGEPSHGPDFEAPEALHGRGHDAHQGGSELETLVKRIPGVPRFIRLFRLCDILNRLQHL